MRLLRSFDWRLLIIFFLVAGIVHLVMTFLAVNDTRASAYTRLAHTYPKNKMTIADAIAPRRQPLPFLAPDARYAFCPFETKNGTMRVKALLPDLGWTIGVYAPDGTNLYFAAASADRETTIDLSIISSEDRFQGLPVTNPANVDPQQTIAAARGLVVVRAPDKGEPYRTDELAVLAKAACKLDGA
ncbi:MULTISPECIES: hypothetical protein [unclassified Hyphomicrobium]|uniref:DUF1254 domain-containing protein n=1 Tax=unclassified Hyphomicrobium TaxID=2619925 RepID=UPI000213D371|nr:MULTISPECIES: hypothetical protein [unclassified Hyphomicrobium]CCB65622.1 conserved protein of unknown function [Hyphomicrobium sp. MC1]